MSTAPIFVLIFLLTASGVGGVLYAVFQPRFIYQARLKRRLRLAAGARSGVPSKSGSAGKSRKRSIEDTLKEIAEKQKGNDASGLTLSERLRQSGLGWTRTTYLTISAFVAVMAYVAIAFGVGISSVVAAGLSLMLGLLLPHLYVGRKRNRRLLSFGNEFPNAVDVIVRGTRSGLPLSDCLRVIATEGQDPVRTEFKGVIDDQTMGVPLQDAILRLADRVPLPETTFLATVITIQSRSGGNLTEALGNLSTVLRERKKMRGKIKALSAEAKASAWIIGALPPVVAGVLYLTSPQYISLLFTTTLGNVVLSACALWMLIGILVMRTMINFDF